MLYPQFITAAEACQDEIQAYNDATEVACQLSKEHGMWNYGDFWVNTIWPAWAQNAGGNGAAFNDGAYDLATMFGANMNFTVIDPGNLPTAENYSSFCLADCYTTGAGCDWAFELVPPPEWGIPDIFNRTMPVISDEQYCQSGIHDADVAFQNLKVCAAEAIGATPVNGMSTEEYLTMLKAQKTTCFACSTAKCATEDANAGSRAAVGAATSPAVILMGTLVVIGVGGLL